MPKVKGNATFPAKHGGTIIVRPSGTCSLRYWVPDGGKDGKDAQRQQPFRDQVDPTTGKVTRTARQLAEDFSLKLAVGKREGDVSFADKSKAAVKFTDFAREWIASHPNARTRTTLESTLRVIEGDLTDLQ